MIPSMAAIGRPANLIRSTVVSKPGAALEVTVFHIPAHIIKEQPMQIHRSRLSLKNIFRMIGQFLSQLFNGKLHRHGGLFAPCIGVLTKCPDGVDSGTNNPSIFLTPVVDHAGNFLVVQKSTDASFTTSSSQEIQMNGDPLGVYDISDDSMTNPGTYYLRARERNAAGTEFSDWSTTYIYTVA
jgi:hypothetical protein